MSIFTKVYKPSEYEVNESYIQMKRRVVFTLGYIYINFKEYAHMIPIFPSKPYISTNTQ